MTSKMGIVLRELSGGGVGEGPIEVLTRVKDFNVVDVASAEGKRVEAAADSLVAFTAAMFRELLDPDVSPTGPNRAGADVWEFRVQTPASQSGAPPVSAKMYVAGEDIFSVRVFSKVIG